LIDSTRLPIHVQ